MSDVVKLERPEVPAERTGDLVAMAIDRDLDIEKLRALIDMRNAQEERENKRVFDEHFAAMQAEFEPVTRSKQGDKAKYAPLDALQKAHKPIISRHGFSYRWDETPLADGGIRITMTISGWGHAVDNHKDLPRYEPDKSSAGKSIMNAMQAEGVRSTYGMRYTFVSGFGLILEDEDTDGSDALLLEMGARYAEQIRAIRSETTIDGVRKVGTELYQQLKKDGDTQGADAIVKAVTARKKELA